jgi:hypothetical protein
MTRELPFFVKPARHGNQTKFCFSPMEKYYLKVTASGKANVVNQSEE